jgi:hypothetical protein
MTLNTKKKLEAVGSKKYDPRVLPGIKTEFS